MNGQDFTLSFRVDQTPEQAFEAILNVDQWWSESIEGTTRRVGDEFAYRYKDLHFSKQRLTELIPGQKVVWLVTDSELTFLEEKDEWTDTSFGFELSTKDGQTEVRFIHWGLLPEVECFEACKRGWSYFILESLQPLIKTGKGQPNVEL